jgi:alpha,alpha-trehalose phosphorylase
VAGLGGLRSQHGMLTFAPRLPATIARLAFTISTHGQQLRAEIISSAATYALAGGPPVQIGHHGQPATLQAGQPLTLPIPAAPRVSRLAQPRGREPARRAARLH